MTIRIVFVLLLTLSVTLQTTAQSVSLRSQTYNAYLSADPAKWEALTAAYENKARHNVLGDLLQLVHCYYGYTMLLVEKKQDDKAAKCNIGFVPQQRLSSRLQRSFHQLPNIAQ